MKCPEEFNAIIADSDIVIAATGSPVVNNVTNELCLKHNVPAVYAGVWERAMGGYVLRVIPGQTACYNCVHEILLKTTPPLDKVKIIDYAQIIDPNQLRAEPSLSIDVYIIALLQAKVALLTLLRNEDGNVEDIPQDYVLWFNKTYEHFKPFTCLKVYTKRRKDCPVCSYEKWLEVKTKSFKEDSNLQNGVVS